MAQCSVVIFDPPSLLFSIVGVLTTDFPSHLMGLLHELTCAVLDPLCESGHQCAADGNDHTIVLVDATVGCPVPLLEPPGFFTQNLIYGFARCVVVVDEDGVRVEPIMYSFRVIAIYDHV